MFVQQAQLLVKVLVIPIAAVLLQRLALLSETPALDLWAAVRMEAVVEEQSRRALLQILHVLIL